MSIEVVNFPDSILLQIFSSLSHSELRYRVRLVSSHWRSLSYDRYLWKRCFKERILFTDATFTQLLTKVGPGIEHLDLDACVGLTPSCLKVVSQLCTNLVSIQWTSMPCLLTHDPQINLRDFIMCRPDLESYVFSPDVNCYPDVLELCSGNLNRLELQVSAFVHDDAVKEVKVKCLQSSMLTIAGRNPQIHSLHTDIVEHSDLLVDVLRLCPRVTELKVTDTLWRVDISDDLVTQMVHVQRLTLDYTLVDDRAFVELIKGCRKLTSVSISGCRNITDFGIMQLVQTHPSIQRLILNDSAQISGNVTDLGLSKVAACLQELRALYISFCPSVTTSGVEDIARNCRYLEDIHMVGCISLTDAAFVAIAEHSRRLRTLHADHCIQLRSNAVEALLRNLPQLTSLHLESCRNVNNINMIHTDPGVEVQGLNLRHLSLSFCAQLEPTGIDCLARHCPLLQTVNLTACCQLQDSSIETLTRGCRELRTLDLSSGSTFRLTRLTDASLRSIAKNSQRLQDLHIRSNFQITLVGVEAVLEGCRQLTQLSLTTGRTDSLIYGRTTQLMANVRGTCRLWDEMGGGRLMDVNTFPHTHKGKCTFFVPPLLE